MKKSTVVLALVLAASWQSVTAADVTGKVTLKGTPPPETPIDFSTNPECVQMQPTVTTSRRYVVGKDNGLKDVFVYISKGCEGKTFPVPSQPVEIDQLKCTYQPYIVGAMVGQTILFKNSDAPPITHNIDFTPAPTSGNAGFNLMQTTQGETATKTFTKPEVLVKIKCDVHRWMLTYVGVCDNPFFCVTDENGKFKIPNLPAGEYTLTAYHLKAHGTSPGVSQTIKVEGDKPVTADFTVEVPAP